MRLGLFSRVVVDAAISFVLLLFGRVVLNGNSVDCRSCCECNLVDFSLPTSSSGRLVAVLVDRGACWHCGTGFRSGTSHGRSFLNAACTVGMTADGRTYVSACLAAPAPSGQFAISNLTAMTSNRYNRLSCDLVSEEFSENSSKIDTFPTESTTFRRVRIVLEEI